MRYMGWSWHDLMSTPASVVSEIISIMREQAEQAEMDRLLNQS